VVGELQGLGHVLAVVVDRSLHRLGYHDQRRAVHDGGEVGVVVQDAVEQGRVGDVALVERPAVAELAAAGDEVIQDHRMCPPSSNADATVLPINSEAPAISTFTRR
jgi:hypothetical protein